MTFTQLTARLKNFLRGWLLVWGLTEGLVECVTVCVKSKVILSIMHMTVILQVDLALEAFKRLGVDLDLIHSKPQENCIYDPAEIEKCGPF